MTKLRALLRGDGFLGADREAVVELSSDTALLARLQEPLWHDGAPISHVVVQVRHESDGFCDLKLGRKYLRNVTAIPAERAASGNPLDLSWWRGGPAAITDMAILRRDKIN